MQREQLFEIASYLAELFGLQLKGEVDPIEPTIILSSLQCLFPQDESLEQIKKIQSVEEQWSCTIQFIELNILNGQTIDIENLGIEQIFSIYELIAQYAEQVMNKMEQEQLKAEKIIKKESKQHNNKTKKEKKPKQKVQIVKKDNKIMKNIEPKQGQQRKSNKQETSAKKKKTNINKQQSKNKKSPEKQIKKSPPKQHKVSKQPLQNELIKEITTAIQKPIHKNNLKTNVLMRDAQNIEQVKKVKRQFQYYLKQYKRQGKMKQKLKEKFSNRAQDKLGLIDNYYLKVLQKKQKNIEQMVVNQQLKYFLALRDKKVAFINNIHKLTEKLQKQRQIEWQKQQRQTMKGQKVKVQLKIEQSNAVFAKNLELLRQNYKIAKRKNQLQNYDEKMICKQMQQAMKTKKMQQLQQLKLIWQQQNLKLNNIIGDQQKIKSKLIDIYRKNRP